MDNGAAPDEARLRRAVDLVVDEYDPDQVILFGSAARREMTERSDIDLMVLVEPQNAGRKLKKTRLYRPDKIDVVITTAEHAEAGRLRAGDVRLEALQDGVTIYLKKGAEEIRTGAAMKKGMYDPDKANEYVRLAEEAWRMVQAGEQLDGLSRKVCEQAQQCMELNLKGIIVAQGMTHDFTHSLEDLWTKAESLGVKLPERPDEDALEKLTDHAGELQYGEEASTGVDSDDVWKKTKKSCEELREYARKEVPKMVEATERMNRRMRGMQPPAAGAKGRGPNRADS